MSPHADPAAEASTTQSRDDPGLTARAAVGLLALMLCARLPAYQVNDNLVGDAVARTDLALTWANAPHWISSYLDGANQFGPLHVYVLGTALKLGVSKQRAGPLTSLVFGTLTVLPLAALTRRLFGRSAAVWSGVALALWGVHVQLSTVGASEALSLFLVLSALALFEAGNLRRLVACGLTLTLSCAVRYDTWLLVPLLSLLVLVHGTDRRAALGRAFTFGMCCLPFPVAWLYGNWHATGDALYPLHDVEAFHHEWAVRELQGWGEVRFRVQNLLFWPGVALASLGPLLGGAGMVGMGWAFRARPDARWVLWSAWIPAAYFTFRGAVLANFQPLTRFTVLHVALLLVFIKPGADVFLRRISPGAARAAAALGLASMVGVNAWIAAYTWDARQDPQTRLVPLSPFARSPPEVRQMAALFDAQGAGPRDLVLVDAQPWDYQDMQVAFFINHPWRRVIRRRWTHWEAKLKEKRESGTPDWIIRFEGGELEKTPGVEVREAALQFRGCWYDEVPGAPVPMHLYRTEMSCSSRDIRQLSTP